MNKREMKSYVELAEELAQLRARLAAYEAVVEAAKTWRKDHAPFEHQIQFHADNALRAALDNLPEQG